jgi:hypothetical protein
MGSENERNCSCPVPTGYDIQKAEKNINIPKSHSEGSKNLNGRFLYKAEAYKV